MEGSQFEFTRIRVLTFGVNEAWVTLVSEDCWVWSTSLSSSRRSSYNCLS